MKYIFLSHSINNNTPQYRGERNLKITKKNDFSLGDKNRKINIFIDNHTGTHIDAPAHFIDKGKTITNYPPSFWVAKNIVIIDMPLLKPREIEFKEIINKIGNPKYNKVDFLIIKTGFEKYRKNKQYWQDYPYIGKDLPVKLKKIFINIRFFGIDCISIQNPKHSKVGHIAHINFFKNNILIIEDMKLSKLNKPLKKVIISPLLIKNADASPATIFGVYE